MTITETSEKTVEVNVLRDLANCLQENTGRQVTIVAPTQIEERRYGYDDILKGLPPGRTIALQFKRPYPKNSDYADFQISGRQHSTLRRKFRLPNHAFYVLSPFPTIREIMNIRSTLLNKTIVIDVQSNSILNPHRRRRRTIRIKKHPMTTVSISDHRRFTQIHDFRMADSLCHDLRSGAVGRHYSGGVFSDPPLDYYEKIDNSDLEINDDKIAQKKMLYNLKISYLHFADQ